MCTEEVGAVAVCDRINAIEIIIQKFVVDR